MANVQEELARILAAVYGEEVRGSIHDAIAAMNEESTAAYTAAIESQASATAKAAEAAESAEQAANIASETEQFVDQSKTEINQIISDANTSLDEKISDAETDINGKISAADAAMADQVNIATTKANEAKTYRDETKETADSIETEWQELLEHDIKAIYGRLNPKQTASSTDYIIIGTQENVDKIKVEDLLKDVQVKIDSLTPEQKSQIIGHLEDDSSDTGD